MKLEEVFLNDLAQSNLVDVDRPPMRIDITGVGQPTPPEEVGPAPADDFTAMATEMAGGMEPAGAQPMTLGQFATSVADVPAGLVKGAIQGTVGLPGDIESLTYGVRQLFNRGAGEGALDAFLRGLEEKTILPTTENVKKWLDENVGPLVPEGADPRRIEAAKIPEFVGELGGAGKTAIETARAAGRGIRKITNASSDVVRSATSQKQTQSVGSETFVPQVVNKGKSIEIAPELTVDIAPSVRTKNFKNWFGESKVVDNNGKPLVMYHGTVEGNIRAFDRNKLGLIFATPDKRFANEFSMRGMGDAPSKNIEAMEEDLLSPNVIPLYVSAKNPFDYQNKDHVNAVIKALEELEDKGMQIEGIAMDANRLASGSWELLESESVVRGIKDAGFDAMYVLEDGVKNIAVFNPRQLKSAIGNIGTFDPKNPDFIRGVVPTTGAAAGAATMQDNEERM